MHASAGQTSDPAKPLVFRWTLTQNLGLMIQKRQ